MEDWAVVVIVIASNIVVALATYFATRIQVRHADKRFEKELEWEGQKDYRERRREVRGEALLKLRSELARMASMQEMVVRTAHQQHTRVGLTEEEVKEQLWEAVFDWNNYIRSGEWVQTLFILDDAELLNKVEEVLKEYRQSYVDAMYWEELKATEIGKAMEVFERNKTRIMEIQALINERLENI